MLIISRLPSSCWCEGVKQGSPSLDHLYDLFNSGSLDPLRVNSSADSRCCLKEKAVIYLEQIPCVLLYFSHLSQTWAIVLCHSLALSMHDGGDDFAGGDISRSSSHGAIQA